MKKATTQILKKFGTFFVLATATLNVSAQGEGEAQPAQPAPAPAPAPFHIGAPKISGFANIRYQTSDKDGYNSGLDIRRVRLSASGKIHPKVDYKVQAEYETTVKILDAYFRWKVVPEFNVQIGQFKVPFTQESFVSPTDLVAIDNHLVVSKLNGYQDLSGIKANGRDEGLEIYGSFFHKEGYSILEYKLGVFNGDGINTTAKRDRKDGALLIYINPIKDLTISLGHYEGSYYGTDITKSGDTEEDNHVRNRSTAGAKYDDHKFFIESEYIYGNTAGLISQGAYAIFAYSITPKWQPLVSYDYFRKDDDSSADDQIYQVGLNYRPIPNLRLQAAYSFKKSTGVDDENYGVIQALFKF